MNVMVIISVAVFLILVGVALGVHRWLFFEVEASDGVYGINERGESGTSDQGDVVGTVHSVDPESSFTS